MRISDWSSDVCSSDLQSNSSLIVDDKAIVKIIRTLARGRHPEAEMGRYLTDAGYANIAPLLVEVTQVEADAASKVLDVVQGYVHTKGVACGWKLHLPSRTVRGRTGGWCVGNVGGSQG